MKRLALEEQGRAFDLAYFILGEPAAAGRAALRALGWWRARCAKIQKRKYFRPARFRVKASLPELALLQTLVCHATLPEEKAQEADGANIADEALIIRFIKHLTLITTERNSFYTALAMCALLHDYGYEQAADVYDFVMQDGGRIKGVEYFRKRKQVLLQELAERFGSRLQWVTAQHGEKRWAARVVAEAETELARRCLAAFTPWETVCVLPANARDRDAPQPALCFDGQHPDGEYAVELKRLHTLTHPVCLVRLTQILGLETPATRLSLPLFFHENGADEADKPVSRDEILDDLNRQLAQDERRRRKLSPAVLSLRVDGKTRAVWDLSESMKLSLDAGDRLLEAWAEDAEGPLLWFSHLVLPRDTGPAAVTFVAPDNKFTLTLQPCCDNEGEYAGGMLVGECRRRTWGESLFRWPVLVYVAAGVLLCALAVGLWQRGKDDAEPLIAQITPPVPALAVTPTLPKIAPSPAPAVTPKIAVPTPTTAATPARTVPTPRPTVRESGGVRSGAPPTVTLPDKIESVFIAAPDVSDIPAQEVYSSVVKHLRAAGRLSVKDSPLEADVTLRLRVRKRGDRLTVHAELLAKPPYQGAWPLPAKTGPDAAELGRQVAEELLKRAGP